MLRYLFIGVSVLQSLNIIWAVLWHQSALFAYQKHHLFYHLSLTYHSKTTKSEYTDGVLFSMAV